MNKLGILILQKEKRKFVEKNVFSFYLKALIPMVSVVLFLLYLTTCVGLVVLVFSGGLKIGINSLLLVIVALMMSVFLGSICSEKVVGKMFNEFHNIIERKINKTLQSLSDDEFLKSNFVSSKMKQRYQINLGDAIFHEDGGHFPETKTKYTVEKISNDEKYVLLKDKNNNYKEIAIKTLIKNYWC